MRARSVVTGCLLSLSAACGSPALPPPPGPPSPEPVAPRAEPVRAEEPARPLEVAASEPECPEARQTEAGACAIELDSPPEPDSSSSPVEETPVAKALPPDPRDPRVAKLRPRARALMVTELQALEKLFAATGKTSPDRPALMRRLAEGYIELGYSAANEPDGAKLADAARKKALQHYLALRTEYPAYSKLEEVLYYAGYEHERAGDLARARALYRELATKFPSSPFLSRIPASVFKP